MLVIFIETEAIPRAIRPPTVPVTIAVIISGPNERNPPDIIIIAGISIPKPTINPIKKPSCQSCPF